MGIFTVLKQFFQSKATLFSNFSYMAFLQVFMMVSSLITYPYLVKVFGRELYGVVLTAQVLASYVTLVVGFGSDNVCAKFVSQYRTDKEKLSEIVSSVLILRMLIWFFSFFVYGLIVFVIPTYRSYMVLFLLTYGLSMQKLLLPQFFFQGLEKMKIPSLINVGSNLLFLCLIFIVVRDKNDVLLVPIFYSLGFFCGGVASLYIIFKNMNIHFKVPQVKIMIFYLKESIPVFATEVISTIKDKFNILLLGSFAGMGNVVIYDLASKICSLQNLPSSLISYVTLPRTSVNKDYKKVEKIMLFTVLLCLLLCLVVNLFLPYIVSFFLHEEIDLWPIRLYSLAPIFLSISVIIGINHFIGFGYVKYTLYSIIITTIAYFVAVAFFYFTENFDNVYSFVLISLFSYVVESIYKLGTYRKIKEKDSRSSIVL